ncbi:MAG TPA: amidohydrolase family protein [Solirubrobacterales bacterium]|jgi:aminocarboxymuconate-semialdehyde decarboxylase|nr:amidohydrolase family protein [Solirubrobacterales bacterium]
MRGLSISPVVDVHTHYIPEELIELIDSGQGPTGLTVERRDGKDPLIVHDNGLRYPAFEVFRDHRARLTYMDERGIDVSVISISPSLYLYWLDPGETVEISRVLNDAAARMAKEGDGRLHAMATVPMNDPTAAAEELRRARGELGLVGVEIGTSVGTRQLDSPDLDVFFSAAAELGMPVMLHPYLSMITEPGTDTEGYHLANVIGNPMETFVAGCRLAVGGVFDRHPDLRVLLVHGGGAFPYQAGRLQHAYDVREETRATAKRPPLDYLDNLLFDTVVFEPAPLNYLIDLVGPERVVFGTDLPFDMGDDSALRELSDGSRPALADQVLGGNALELFGIGQKAGGTATVR